MRNFKMTLSYDGSRYFGWERQPGKETIQGKLEAVLTRMCGAPVNVIGAGRTDAGAVSYTHLTLPTTHIV